MNYRSEALKIGIKLENSINKMTDEEIKKFQNSIDPDSMGFDGQEGMDLKEDIICP